MVQNPIGHSSPPKSDKYHYPPRFFLRGLCIIHDISKLYEIIKLTWISTLTNSPNAGDGIPWCFFCPAPPLRPWLPL